MPGSDHGLNSDPRTDRPQIAKETHAAVPGTAPKATRTTTTDHPSQGHQHEEEDADQDQEDQEEALPDTQMIGDRLTAVDRVLMLIRHWTQLANDGARSAGVLAAQPESFAQYRAYVRSRAWLPEGYDRGWLVWVTVAYYNTLGTAGVAGGYAIAWLFGRVLHFNVAVTVTAAAALLWLIFG